MCRIFYALNQSYLHSKIRNFWAHSRSMRNESLALDGHGIAGFNATTHKWKVHRSPGPPDADPLNESVTDQMSEYPLVIGQLRNTLESNPARPSIENTHPFYYKNRLFLHNGRLGDAPFSEQHRNHVLQHILPGFKAHIKGQTDTELAFYLFLSILTTTEQSSRDIAAVSGPNARGCSKPTRFDVLRDSVKKLFRFLDAEFNTYIANFVYADKEHSIIVHAMKNETVKDKRISPMYLNHPAHNKGLLFSSEPISKNYEPVKLNTFYIVNHLTGEYQVVTL